jgi:hypothetical protein
MSDRHNVSTASAKGAAPESPARSGLRSDYKVAAVVTVFAIVVYALTMTFDKVPKALTQGVPPESYPRLLVWILIVLSVALVFEARGRGNVVMKRPPMIVYKTAAALVIATGSIQWLGIFSAMLVTCIAVPVIWGERRHVITGLFAVLLSLAVYGLFHGILEVQFPLGIFASMF